MANFQTITTEMILSGHILTRKWKALSSSYYIQIPQKQAKVLGLEDGDLITYGIMDIRKAKPIEERS